MLTEYLKKNKKSVNAALIVTAILHFGCLIPFIYTGIAKSAWDVYIYLDYLTVFVIVLLCFTLAYRELKINKIRKKTKNLINPLSDKEKEEYKKIVNPVLYETIISIVVFILVTLIDYSLLG